MKLHHQEITIKVLVPEGYHVSKVNPEQAVVPRLAECLEVDYNTIADIITTRITIKKDVYKDKNHIANARMKPAYRVYADQDGDLFVAERNSEGGVCQTFTDGCEWVAEWVEYDPPK